LQKREIHSKEEYETLVLEMQEHDRLYYQECAPIISDYEYDLLLKVLEKYEKEHPEHVLATSPTKRVGEAPSKGFVQGQHMTPMLSLANTYSEEEVKSFLERVYKLTENQNLIFCVELKMDGTAISVRYEKGVFVRALTRGDGISGDDVTANVKTIKSLPLQLKGKNIPEILEIRGEVFMAKKAFQMLNLQRQEEGLDVWANPRNAAAGSLKLLDPKEVAKRKLDIIFYAIAEGEKYVSSQHELHVYLKNLGLNVGNEKYYAKCKNIEEIMHFADKIKKERDNLPFEIDGIVIKVDDLFLYDTLGVTGKSPRYATAYKFAPERAITRINDITIQVGRSGVLTPVAELEPVHLAGSTISRATLHNQDEVQRKDIRIGDYVVIEKGGDVIPKVVEVDKHGGQAPWHMPSTCPICNTKVIHIEGEVAVRCPNENCKGRKLRHLIFFASKHAMDIEHLGEKIVEKLFLSGFLTKPSDLYLLNEEKLKTIEGFKEKSVHNLLHSIEKSKQCDLCQFIMGLEIKYVGKETAELLADHIDKIDDLFHMNKEMLLQMEGIGEKTAQTILEYFQDHSNIEEIELLLKYGVNPKSSKKQKNYDHSFANKTFVLTGTLLKFSRDEASKLIKERGGYTSSSVSSKTDFLLMGEDPGSKYDKAKMLGVKILTEEEFVKLL